MLFGSGRPWAYITRQLEQPELIMTVVINDQRVGGNQGRGGTLGSHFRHATVPVQQRRILPAHQFGINLDASATSDGRPLAGRIRAHWSPLVGLAVTASARRCEIWHV